jgi:hypothetical protein
LTIQCSTEAPWLWIQREKKKERKKETSIIHLCVAFIIGKRECCFFIIEKEKGSPRKQVFSYSGSFLDLKKLLFFFLFFYIYINKWSILVHLNSSLPMP